MDLSLKPISSLEAPLTPEMTSGLERVVSIYLDGDGDGEGRAVSAQFTPDPPCLGRSLAPVAVCKDSVLLHALLLRLVLLLVFFPSHFLVYNVNLGMSDPY